MRFDEGELTLNQHDHEATKISENSGLPMTTCLARNAAST